MNELTVFNKDVIPVYETDEGRKVVIGRELHEQLKIESPYHKWFPRMCEYGFSEPEDFLDIFVRKYRRPPQQMTTTSPWRWPNTSP